MNNYRCSWVIEVSADTPEEAARQAEDLMTERQASTWTVAKLNDDRSAGQETDVQL